MQFSFYIFSQLGMPWGMILYQC